MIRRILANLIDHGISSSIMYNTDKIININKTPGIILLSIELPPKNDLKKQVLLSTQQFVGYKHPII